MQKFFSLGNSKFWFLFSKIEHYEHSQKGRVHFETFQLWHAPTSVKTFSFLMISYNSLLQLQLSIFFIPQYMSFKLSSSFFEIFVTSFFAMFEFKLFPTFISMIFIPHEPTLAIICFHTFLIAWELWIFFTKLRKFSLKLKKLVQMQNWINTYVEIQLSWHFHIFIIHHLENQAYLYKCMNMSIFTFKYLLFTVSFRFAFKLVL